MENGVIATCSSNENYYIRRDEKGKMKEKWGVNNLNRKKKKV